MNIKQTETMTITIIEYLDSLTAYNLRQLKNQELSKDLK